MLTIEITFRNKRRFARSINVLPSRFLDAARALHTQGCAVVAATLYAKRGPLASRVACWTAPPHGWMAAG